MDIKENRMKLTFCHNVYNRFNILKKTIEIEKEHFPDSNFVVSYNSELSEILDNVEYVYYGPNQGHKLGSYNGVLYSLKKADEIDSDIIVFSHDDTYLSNIKLFKSNLNLIGDYDYVGRNITLRVTKTEKYLMFESIIISKKFLSTLVNNWQPINKENEFGNDAWNCPGPEITFGSIIKSKSEGFKIFTYDIPENSFGENALGYFHIAGERGWH